MLCPLPIVPAHGVASMDSLPHSLRKASCCQGKQVLVICVHSCRRQFRQEVRFPKILKPSTF